MTVLRRKKVEPNKPPYKIPSMDEIRAVPQNGFKAISTFSGCGGSSLGYRMAGFKVLWANEFIEAARDTYAANFPDTIMDPRDIREVSPESILKAIGMKRGELDLLDGSPPCAAFSTAGKRSAGWGEVKDYSDTRQRVDDLFFEFSRLLDGLQPKVFVAENVSGLVKGVAKGYFKEILARLKGCGYDVAARVLDAKWLGVPQSRQRLIFVGVRRDLGVAPAHPSPLPHVYTIKDAIPWVLRATLDTKGQFTKKGFTGQPSPAITCGKKGSACDHFRVEAETDISAYAIGKEYDSIRQGEASEKYFSLVKPRIDEPCPTITQTAGGNPGAAGVVHPTEKRKFSIAELRRICAFPDDFILTGRYRQQWERLGRAVPPVMMFHIASAVRDQVLRKVRP